MADQTPPPFKLKRPAEKLLQGFWIEDIGGDTVGEYLAKNFSLVICCKNCTRMIEWTPPELVDRFGDKPKLKIADIAARLSCNGDEGCGSHDVAVFPIPCTT